MSAATTTTKPRVDGANLLAAINAQLHQLPDPGDAVTANERLRLRQERQRLEAQRGHVGQLINLIAGGAARDARRGKRRSTSRRRN